MLYSFNHYVAQVLNDPSCDNDDQDDYFSIQVNNRAQVMPGTYQIEIEQLAQRQKLATRPFASANTNIGMSAGTLRFTLQPTNEVVDIDITNVQSLEEIKRLINHLSGTAKIAASLLTVDAGIVLLISPAGPETYISQLHMIPSSATQPDRTSPFDMRNLTKITAPLQASVKIDGYRVTTNTNALVDVIDGITIYLHKACTNKVHTLKIESIIDHSLDSSLPCC